MADFNAGRLLYVITGDDSGLKASLKKSGDAAKATGDKINKGLGGIKAGWLGAVAAVAGYVVAVKDVLSAYIAQERADIKLRSALKATGDASKETFNDFKNFASEMQKVTTVGDEATQEIIALGLRMGISTDQIKDATKGAIGLSQSLGIDLQSALKIVAQGMDGQYTMLSRYIPALRSATTESEKAAIFQKVLNDGFQEAKDITQGYIGSVEQMKNAVGDAKEEIGKVVADALLPFVKLIAQGAEAFTKLDPGIRKATLAGAAAIPVFLGLSGALGPIGVAISAVLLAATGAMAIYEKTKEIRNTRVEEALLLLEKIDEANKKITVSSKTALTSGRSLDGQIQLMKDNNNQWGTYNDKLDDSQIALNKMLKELGLTEEQLRAMSKTTKETTADDKIKLKSTNDLIEKYKKEKKLITDKNASLGETDKTYSDLLSLAKKYYDEAVSTLGLESTAAQGMAAAYKEAKVSYEAFIESQEKAPAATNPIEVFSKMDESLNAVRLAFAGMTGEMAEAMSALVSSTTEVMQGLNKLRTEGAITASDWITLIIQVIQSFVKLASEFYGLLSGAAFDNGMKGLGRFLKFWSELYSSLLDIRSAIIPIFGTIWTMAEKANGEMADSMKSAKDATDEAIESIQEYAATLSAALLNQALDAWEKYAKEVININTGLNKYLEKQSEYQALREERMKQDELGILQDVLRSSLSEREKYLAQLRIDEIENEKLLESARIEAARQQADLEKKLALARLAIKAAEFESSINVRMAELEADESAALAGTATIIGKGRRTAAQTVIKNAYQAAYTALGRAAGVGVAGLNLERGLITGEVSPDTIGAGTFVDEASKRMQRPIVITLDGKQIASTVQDYNLNNLLPAKAS